MRLGRILKVVVKILLFFILTVFFAHGVRMRYGDGLSGFIMQIVVMVLLFYILFVGRVGILRGVGLLPLLILFVLYTVEFVLVSVFILLVYLVIVNRHVIPYVLLSLKSIFRRIRRGVYGLLGVGD